MTDSPTKVEPIICGGCFQDITPSPDNPTLICPMCGVENRPVMSSDEQLPEPPVPPRTRRRLAMAEKVVLWFIGLPAVGFALSLLGGVQSGSVAFLGVYALAVVIYFAPSLIGKEKANAGAILALNLFLGWTLVGWVVALVWAYTKEAADDTAGEVRVRCPQCAELILAQAHVCKHCGAKLIPS